MLKLGIKQAIIHAKPADNEQTIAGLVIAVRSDKHPGTNEEVALLNKALKDLGAIDFDTEENTVESVNSTINYEESNVYDRVKNILVRQSLRGVAPIEAIKALEGPENDGMLLAVRDWLNEVTK